MYTERREPFPADDGSNPYDLSDVAPLYRLYEKAPDTRLESLLGDTGGKYVTPTGLPCCDGRPDKTYDWGGQISDAGYYSALSMRSTARSFLDIATGKYHTSDTEVIAQLPLISTAFRFVIDRRPLGQENAYIPARTYTTYFANQQIPVAAPGHSLHSHDTLHTSSFARVFSIPEFAEMVSAAADNALAVSDESGCTEFTNAMDQFGDALIIDELLSPDHYELGSAGYVLGSARIKLRRLVSLYMQNQSEEPPTLGDTETAVFDMLWQKLGFAAKEAHKQRSRRMGWLDKYLELDGGGTYHDYDLTTPASTLPESSYDFSGPRYGAETGHDFETIKPVTKNGYPIPDTEYGKYQLILDEYLSNVETYWKNEQ